MQRILKAVLDAQVLVPVPAPVPAPIPVSAFIPASDPAPAPNPAPIVAEARRKKLKAYSPNIYREKSHMDCYNFCQQCENYFATAGATGPTRIPFAASSL